MLCQLFLLLGAGLHVCRFQTQRQYRVESARPPPPCRVIVVDVPCKIGAIGFFLFKICPHWHMVVVKVAVFVDLDVDTVQDYHQQMITERSWHCGLESRQEFITVLCVFSYFKGTVSPVISFILEPTFLLLKTFYFIHIYFFSYLNIHFKLLPWKQLLFMQIITEIW